MNWLAHMYLARHSDAAMLGSLLGDFAFGSSGLERFGQVEHTEILLHRRIDHFTDTHPEVVALRELIADGRRRYSGIVFDMYFDHLLARDWGRWMQLDPSQATPLAEFTRRAYRILRERFDELPPRLQAIAPAMTEHDWLGGYRVRANVDRAVSRIATRLSRNGERLVACLDDLRRIEPIAEAAFEQFFPALFEFTEQTRAQWQRAGGALPG